MNDNLKFTDEENHYFTKMIDCYIKAAEDELRGLKDIGGNPRFIPLVDKELNIYKTIKAKIVDVFCYL